MREKKKKEREKEERQGANETRPTSLIVTWVVQLNL